MKTAELPPDRNYVLSVHPHGIMCVGAFCNFSTDVTGFSKKFPGIQTSMTGLGVLFHLPVYREYLMSYGEPGAEQEEAAIPSQPPLPPPPPPPPPTASQAPSAGTQPEHWPVSQRASVKSSRANDPHPCKERHSRSH